MIRYNVIKSELIPIKNTNTNTYKNTKNNEYTLKNHNFDPSKSSPPNDFMSKLKKRLTFYDFISISSEIKCNSLVNV